MIKKTISTAFVILLTSQAFSQSCQTEKGVNLADPGKPYSSIIPRNQGALGTCYAHSGTDLIRSYLNISQPMNILDAAVNADVDVNGGMPDDVINELVKRGWACGDTSKFSNFFPSTHKNILSDLLSLTITMPVFYSNSIYTPYGKDRQIRIAGLAAQKVDNPKDCVKCQELKNQYILVDDLSTKLEKIDEINAKLDDEKNLIDWRWLNKLMGDRSNSEIEAIIKKNNSKHEQITKQLQGVEKRKDDYLKYFNEGKNRLDDIGEDEAASIVYYWAVDNYAEMVKVFERYGMSKSITPTLKEFIVDRVEYDPETKFTYAGAMYPYKLMKRVMAKSCEGYKIKIPSNLKTKKISTVTQRPQAELKIKSLFESASPQGIAINLHSDLLSKGTWSSSNSADNHAVNLIGCRTKNGKLQYLIHNSWGTGCSNYSPNFECVGGRVWINAQSVLGASSEIVWLERN